jgi:hypothetical protein
MGVPGRIRWGPKVGRHVPVILGVENKPSWPLQCGRPLGR